MGFNTIDGLTIFTKNRYLRNILLFTAVSWILIDVGMIFGNFSLSPIWISFCIFIIHILLLLLLIAIFGKSEIWTTKKILIILLCSTPFYLISFYLMFQLGLGIILIFSDVIINVILAQWFCINTGDYFQDKTKNHPSIGFLIYFICGILGVIFYSTLITKFNPPSNYVGIWGSLSIVRVLFIGFLIFGFFLGLIRKQIPVALGPFFLISFFYFFYLFMRSFLLNQGYSTTNLTLISIPMNIFLFVYACGKISYQFFIKRGTTQPSSRVQASLIYFMLIQVGVHVAVIISLNNPNSSITIDELLAFLALALFLLFSLISGVYILIKNTKKEKSPKIRD